MVENKKSILIADNNKENTNKKMEKVSAKRIAAYPKIQILSKKKQKQQINSK